MHSGRKKRSRQKDGGGFCLLPWGKAFRDGAMREWSSACLAVLPVIAAHANKEGEAWPSYELICALASVSKGTVSKALEELSRMGLVVISKQQGVNTYNRYRLCFGDYDGNSREHIAIYHKLIFSGCWGAMSPSTKRVYLLFRAFAWTGKNAVHLGHNEHPDDLEPIEVNIRGKWREFKHSEFNYLPDHIYAPAEFTRLAGVSSRTFRNALTWLVENGIFGLYDGTDDISGGLIIPFQPVVRFRSVVDAVEKVKKESAERKARPGALRSIKALRRRIALGKMPSSTNKEHL